MRRRKLLLQPDVPELVDGTGLPEHCELVGIDKKAIVLHGIRLVQASQMRASLKHSDAVPTAPKTILQRRLATAYRPYASAITGAKNSHNTIALDALFMNT